MAKTKKLNKEFRQEIAKLTVAYGNLHIHQDTRGNNLELDALDAMGNTLSLYRALLGLGSGWSDEDELEIADEGRG